MVVSCEVGTELIKMDDCVHVRLCLNQLAVVLLGEFGSCEPF